MYRKCIKMPDIAKSYWALALGVLSVSFVGYCVYFDHKRRSAPEFREKLKEKRRKQKQKPLLNQDDSSVEVDITNAEEMKRFFLIQIQKGEERLSQGDLDAGVEHLAKAVAVCSQPQSLMALFQQSLPPELFQEIIMRLPRAAQSIHHNRSDSFMRNSTTILNEPDLE
ncbi:unnamed protein product [Didymodactylos carnosus]|uniref:Mitochondrial import receptor subunit TOM20 n=1 Tax=Didymodactylos carnosus TaxID=1234261 RepID=A0A814AIA4_9BILA|nr:unnamed protein product [Didymodactylos carnosus]CAF0912255.1 unnamed protein product [Didymodactylos carnosus]CAF3575422.1 unnamed protein product [Didymodactylos carnosus]CAF3693129.1 unnamed protein product [Didymodactylos carnosus]